MKMNFRVVLLVFLVVFFMVGATYLNVHSFESSSLKDTYNAGDLEIIQNTTSGTVPHTIQVINKGQKPVKVEVGQIFGSNSYQDMVVAEEMTINQNSSIYIRAYCFEPKQVAKPGEKLKPTGKASTEIIQVIEGSNLADSNSSLQAQLQIWTIVSGDNITTTTGEVPAVMKNQGLTSYQMSQLINQSRTNLAQTLGVSQGQLKDISSTSSVGSSISSSINGFFDWIKEAFNIT